MARRTKILATLGPACSDPETIRAMVEAGMDGARLNFSHGDPESHEAFAEAVRSAASAAGRPVALVQDLQGTKIRVREVEDDEITLETGAELSITADEATGTARVLTVDNPQLLERLAAGARLFLGDGEVQLEVTSAQADRAEAQVSVGGPVRSGAGITAPGLALPGGLTAKDQEDLLVGRKIGVDYVAASFVSSAADVADAKEFLAAKGETTPVLAKIERRAALDNIAEIVRVADGIMVARGDLGIALPPEEVPVAQKRILRECQRAGVVSITATQMLESMVDSLRPTRAETSDVANAILDGTHVVMLSGETAIGVDPPRAVGTMARIAEETERAIAAGELDRQGGQAVPDGSRDDAIAHAAVLLTDELEAEAIVSMTSSGSTAIRVAKFSPRAPVIGGTPEQATHRRLALVRGVVPFLVPDAGTLDDIIWVAEDAAKAVGAVEPGDTIVLTAGEIGVPGTTNLIRVASVH